MMGEDRKYCSVSLDKSNHTRKCFMTGEYCPRQPQIKRQKDALHAKKEVEKDKEEKVKIDKCEINAFVVMNFSDMSDVVYKWRICTFIESLKEYLYIVTKENDEKEIRCCSKEEYNIALILKKNKIIKDYFAEKPRKSKKFWESADEKNLGAKLSEIKENAVNKYKEDFLHEYNGPKNKFLKNVEEQGLINVVEAFSEEEKNQYKGLNDWLKSMKELQGLIEELENIKYIKHVDKINVIRADSEPSSHYVVCNRICQQMQMADLVVVDVSMQNPNVFYEFGMAVAMDKLILPICYSESFFRMEVPEKLKKLIEKREKDVVEAETGYAENIQEKKTNLKITKKLEKHIDCYPWRRNLFEFYGIKYQSEGTSKDEPKYLKFEKVIKDAYDFTDKKYFKFPYREKVESVGENMIGNYIYDCLRNSYNVSTSKDNTVLIYTMDNFLNEDQVGRCIVNFYRNITSQMRKENCFCGERVGVLVQENVIPEGDKDSKKERNLLYDISEIIRIGVNQATYHAAEETIKTEKVWSKFKMPGKGESVEDTKEEVSVKILSKEEKIIAATKEYIRNRGILIYPNVPFFVSRIKNGFYGDMLINPPKAFCLYHAMLKSLCFTNEIVVDVSNNYNNCVQSLFWLGAAHAMDVYAITVVHEETSKERKLVLGSEEKNNRAIFDVSGLWSAVLKANDTEGFYKQLIMAQKWLERNSKLMLQTQDWEIEEVKDILKLNVSDDVSKNISELHKRKKEKEIRALESFYRTKFWGPMLRYNKLNIYVFKNQAKRKKIGKSVYHESASDCIAKWDFETITAISYYLSKRQLIGEYQIEALGENYFQNKKNNYKKNSYKENYICIGQYVEVEELKNIPGLRYGEREDISTKCECCSYGEKKECGKELCQIRGYKEVDKDNLGVFSWHPKREYVYNGKTGIGELKVDNAEGIIYDFSQIHEDIYKNAKERHVQIARLVLFRTESNNNEKWNLFRVSMMGTSGPATSALASLFVDQKSKVDFPLVELQEKIREKFEEKFFGEFDEIALAKQNNQIKDKEECVEKNRFTKIIWKRIRKDSAVPEILNLQNTNDIEQVKDYLKLVKCAVWHYLNTVLYRYFLPFLTQKDIYKIVNGMKGYLYFMKAARVSPFASNYEDVGESKWPTFISVENMEEIILLIPQVLEYVLNDFKAVEVIYKVTVKNSTDANCDDRRVENIQILGEKYLNCIFESESNKEEKENCESYTD